VYNREISTYDTMDYINDDDDHNNNNNTRTIFIVLSSMAQSHMRQFTLVLLSESRSAQGGCQLVGQVANLTSESACRLL